LSPPVAPRAGQRRQPGPAMPRHSQQPIVP
jgi:hypothetical protein